MGISDASYIVRAASWAPFVAFRLGGILLFNVTSLLDLFTDFFNMHFFHQ